MVTVSLELQYSFMSVKSQSLKNEKIEKRKSAGTIYGDATYNRNKRHVLINLKKKTKTKKRKTSCFRFILFVVLLVWNTRKLS
jgi:hypothetical protein